MRESKFKYYFQHEDTKKIVNSIVLTVSEIENGRLEQILTLAHPKHKILDRCEYTGMVDEDGIEIYEGSYVTNGSIEFYEVVYQAPSFVMKKPLKRGLSKTWQTFIRASHEKQFVKVVGHKYE